MGEGRLLTVDTPHGLRYNAYGGDIVDLRTSGHLDLRDLLLLRDLPFVKGNVTRTSDNSARLTVNEASTAIPELIDWCRGKGMTVDSIEEYLPPFDDVFVEIVRKEGENG
jgi:hypothetical protein